MTTTDTNSTHPVTQRLRHAGITSAVVIDDAFNTPALDDLTDEIADFWTAIDRNDRALSELNDYKPEFEGEDDIDEELINCLWARTLNEEPSSLLILCKTTLFSRQIESLSDLTPLVDYLKGIGITPILLGTEDDLPDGQQRLFFLDFILESDIALPSSGEVEVVIQEFTAGTPANPLIQVSIDKAKQIIDEFDDAFIILMSSKAGVPQAKGRFRQETGLIEGMFDYVPKEQLADEKELSLRLGISAASLPVRHDIQCFVNALATSITEASKEFIDWIKGLSFEDYMYIYSLSLRDEGHPLGDYMSRLNRSLLAHLVHDCDRVIAAQDRLDDIDLKAYVPLKRAPSNHLAEMYSLSLTEPGTSDNTTRLRLGDLYVNSAKSVLLIINADCDLVDAPKSSNRRVPDDSSILLHPGRLIPLDKKVKGNHKVTNLFYHEGEPFQIDWDHEGVISKKYWEVKGWLYFNGYSKKARLIAPHALEIQQHFAAKLTRVGMPVAPRFPTPATIRVFGKNENGTLKKLGDDIPRGVVIDRKNFHFTVEGFSQLLEKVAEGKTHYTAILDCCEINQNRRKRLKDNIRKLEAWLQNYEEWFTLIESSNKMPSGNSQHIGSDGILEVFCTPNLKTAERIIAINLLPDERDTETTVGAQMDGL